MSTVSQNPNPEPQPEPATVPCGRTLPHLPHDKHTPSRYPCPGVPLAPAPLSSEREQEIREWEAELGKGKAPAGVGPYAALRDTLAELDRVREELADQKHDTDYFAQQSTRRLERAQTAERERDELKAHVEAADSLLSAVEALVVESETADTAGIFTTDLRAALDGEPAPHAAPCRWPASPDCTCNTPAGGVS